MMSTVMTAIIAVLLIIGVFFALIGTLGILRMPDVFGRMQASTCIATLSTICVNLAGILYVIAEGLSAGTAVKIVILAVFVLVTNPISNHALCKAAYRIGCKPAKPFCVDDLAADFGEEAHTQNTADLPDSAFDVSGADASQQAEEGELQ